MRFGGLIAAFACIVFADAALAQTPAQQQTTQQQTGQQQTGQPAAGQQQQTPAEPQGTQQQINNPAANAQAAEGNQEPTNPADQKKPTAEEELEQRIRQYDPLAKDDQQTKTGEKDEKNGEKGGKEKSTSGGAEPAASAIPGPSVGGGESSDDTSDYTGPAVLSRSYTLLRPSIPTHEAWNPIIGVNSIYDSGFQTTNANGSSTGGSFGSELFWGISGRHYMRHDVFGVNYRGDMQYYSPAKYFNGSNHWLTLDYSHMFSRRLSLNLVEAGSVYSQNYTLVNPATVSEEAATNLTTSPNTQILDNGWKNFTSGIDVTYQKSIRLSFNAGASGFIFKPEASYLLSATGGSVHGDAMYRVTRRTTVGLAYSYNNFWYPRGAGRSVFHTMNANYSWALARTMQLSAAVGASRLDSTGVLTDYLNPQLEALFGQGVVVQYRSVQWVSNYAAQLSKSFSRGRSVAVAFNRGLVPGNGIYLTSQQTNITVSGSMILFRHYYLSTGLGFYSLSAAAQNLGQFDSTYVFFGASRAMRHGIQANLRFDYRHFDFASVSSLQNTFRITLGFSWSPVEGLHRLW